MDDFEDGSVGPAVKKRKVSPEELGLAPLSVREVAQRIHRLHPNIQGSIPAAIRLMEEGNTIAFIARYRASRCDITALLRNCLCILVNEKCFSEVTPGNGCQDKQHERI